MEVFDPGIGTAPTLLPCPFCGNPPFVVWRRINPRSGCKTDGCLGRRLPYLSLDSDGDLIAWNTRDGIKCNRMTTAKKKEPEREGGASVGIPVGLTTMPLALSAWRGPNWSHGADDYAYYDADDKPGASAVEALYALTPEDVAAVNEARKKCASKALRSFDLCRCDHK